MDRASRQVVDYFAAEPVRVSALLRLPLIGLIGAPLLAASAIGTMFGTFDQVSAIAGLAALPIAAWEFSLGCWLAVRGIRTASQQTPDQMSLASRSSSST